MMDELKDYWQAFLHVDNIDIDGDDELREFVGQDYEPLLATDMFLGRNPKIARAAAEDIFAGMIESGIDINYIIIHRRHDITCQSFDGEKWSEDDIAELVSKESSTEQF